MGKFGWSYPPGAEFDPNAPWNQAELPEVEVEDCNRGEDLECPVCEEIAKWCDKFVGSPGPNYRVRSDFTGWYCDNCGWQQEAYNDPP